MYLLAVQRRIGGLEILEEFDSYILNVQRRIGGLEKITNLND